MSDVELLAVLLPSTGLEADPPDLARSLLKQAGGLAGLLGPEAGGVGLDLAPDSALRLIAVREIATRLWHAELDGREVLKRPGRIANYLLLRYGVVDQEVFGVLLLDLHQRLIGDRELFRGTLTRVAVEPRQVLRAAICSHAAGIVLFHTHPSGDPAPSLDDLEFTDRVGKAAKLVGIEMADHLVVGSFCRWVSLKARGAV